MSIRTTITLDEDVLERVKAESRTRGASFRETLNDLLRLALVAQSAPPVRPAFRVRPRHMGYRPGLNYDDIESLLEYGEGGRHA
jgi:hypothetical protein